jgi:hypothetical protein
MLLGSHAAGGAVVIAETQKVQPYRRQGCAQKAKVKIPIRLYWQESQVTSGGEVYSHCITLLL